MTYNTLTQTFTSPAAEIVCYKCGIPFAVPAEWQRRRRERQDAFWCPNGHEQGYYGKTEADRLRDELAREKHRTEQARADAEHQRRIAAMRERQVAARKGQLTKIKNRLSRGVCTCCNRYFANLHRHMEAQHPGWTPEADPQVERPADVSFRARGAWEQGVAAALTGDAQNPYKNFPYRSVWQRAFDAQRAAPSATPTPEEVG